MDKKEQRVSRITNEERDLAKALFKDNDALLFDVRAAIVGTHFGEGIKTLSHEGINLIEKIMLPKYSDTAPIGGQVNLYLNVASDNTFPEEVVMNIKAANTTRDIIQLGVNNMRAIINGDEATPVTPWLDVDHEDEEAVVKLKTSKVALASLEGGLATLKAMAYAEIKDVTEAESSR